jgi:fatty acid desaturase
VSRAVGNEERRDRMARLPEKRRNVAFRVLSRVAAALALILILGGFILDATDAEGRVEPITLLLVGIYVLGVQIYFLLEYFVETGGIE